MCACRADTKSCPVYYGGRFQDQFAPTGTTDVLGICDDYNAIRKEFSLNNFSFTDQSPLFPSITQFETSN